MSFASAAHQASMFKDLVLTFQGASETLERAYRDLQERVERLTGELEREREQRIRLERLAAMGEMAMELAHEIRNPLASIELYASMLEGEFAGQIVASVRLLNHSVTNVLQFGRPVLPAPSRHLPVEDLLSGVRAVVRPLAEQKRIALETECVAGLELTGDGALLHQMLLNLALNALRETPSGGTIRLLGESTPEGVVLRVTDTGTGIHPDALPRIFDPAFSTHRTGCGLGLSIVKRIVECHGGRIRVETGPSGACFVATFPHDTEVVSEPTACS